VDVGASKTNINIACGETSLFTREIYAGGSDFTSAISRLRGLDFYEAEGFKINPATPDAELNEAVGQTAEELGNEIQMSFDYFENQFDTKVSEVLLTGGGSLLRGLAGAFETKFRKPTRVWDPLSDVAVMDGTFSADVLQSMGPRMAVSLGLASRLCDEGR
jgi:type IV pilus assembly protein PilM